MPCLCYDTYISRELRLLHKRHLAEMNELVKEVGITKTDKHVNELSASHVESIDVYI